MPLRDDLLAPIPGANPGGTDLRYDAVYLKIREARREEENLPPTEMDDGKKPKAADWGQVATLASDALATRSKDLQLAAWLTEALLHRQGFGGLRDGLDVLRALLDGSWEHLYPPLEDDGSAELRAAPLKWLDVPDRLPNTIRAIPLNGSGHGLAKYDEALNVGYEAECGDDPDKLAKRQAALASGKLSPEDFDRGVAAREKAWYKMLVRELDECIAGLEALDAAAHLRFGDASLAASLEDGVPSHPKLRETLDDVRKVAAELLARKLAAEPDPIDADGTGGTASRTTIPHSADALAAASRAGAVTVPSAEAASRDDAIERTIAAARYLRRTDPHSPASYLMLRGLRWGELRVRGSDPDPKLLEAPPTHVRTQLKRLLLDHAWTELLEAAETVMGTPHGRGWLDLQRYALTACDHLGSDFRFVAQALCGALRLLLAEIPSLLDMTLMDDTPTANAETQAWLRASVLDADAAGDHAHEVGATSGNGRSPRDAWDARELAQSEARAGRPERAIELLVRELATEKSQRGRFLRQAQLAGIMVSAGHETVAKPMLEEMLARIEAHKLEEWEAGTLVAEPLSLLYRCLDAADGDAAVKQALYLRICRLDPVQAIAFARK